MFKKVQGQLHVMTTTPESRRVTPEAGYYTVPLHILR